jgi:hypothetical protein
MFCFVFLIFAFSFQINKLEVRVSRRPNCANEARTVRTELGEKDENFCQQPHKLSHFVLIRSPSLGVGLE